MFVRISAEWFRVGAATARIWLRTAAAGLLVATCLMAGCGGDSSNTAGEGGGDPAGDGAGDGAGEVAGEVAGGAGRGSDSGRPTIAFTDITVAAGIDFVHEAGVDGSFWQPEGVVPGCAIFDYDGDGAQDIYFVNGGWLTPEVIEQGRANPSGALYRNRGDGTFENVTTAAGLDGHSAGTSPESRRYGHGCAVGDYDGDGDLDLFLADLGPNRLYRNEGNGTFTEVGSAAGVDDPRWASSGTFADLDLDGDIDLFVTNYCVWSPAGQIPYKSPKGEPDYVAPSAYEPVPNLFYRNNGDGTFQDATREAGFEAAYGHGLAAVVADFDADGRPDVYVANDGDANNVWFQLPDGRFEERGLLSGAALNFSGDAEASMGLTTGDIDDDGDWDLFMTHLSTETNTLYGNDGHGFFEDITDPWGLGAPSMPFTGFGTLFFDPDRDGDLDLYVANGRVNRGEDGTGSWPYAQRDQFFVNEGRRYRELLPEEAAWLEPSLVSRGLAVGDLDGDGDEDLVVANAEAAPRVLRNDTAAPAGTTGRWLGLLLADDGANREGIGATVSVRGVPGDGAAPGPRKWRRISRDGSYASANQPRAVIGLPAGARGADVVVRWPLGDEESWTLDELDRDWVLRKGQGKPGGIDALAARPSQLDDSGGVALRDESLGADSTSRGGRDSGAGFAGGGPEVGVGEIADIAIPELPPLDGVDPDVATRLRQARDRVVAQPRDGAAWKNYGVSLYADGSEFTKAAIALQHSSRLVRDDPTTTYLLALAYQQMGETERMREALERTLSVEEYPAARIRLGRLDLAARDLPAARAHFERVTGLEPANPAAWEGLGATRRQIGQTADAVRDLRRAVDLAPRARSTHYELGLALRSDGQIEAAAHELDLASTLVEDSLVDPWIVELMSGRGGVSSLLSAAKDARLAGDLDRALALYNEYAERVPEDPIGWVNLAAALRDRGRVEESLAAIERCLQLDDTRAEAHAMRGAIQATRGNAVAALESFDRAVELRPDMAQAWLDRGEILHALRRYADAEASFSEYVRIRPRDAVGFLKRGESRLGSGNLVGGKEDLEQALQLDATLAAAHFRLAGIAMANQDPETALSRFDAAIALRSDWAEAIYGKGAAHRMAGRPDSARAWVRRAVALKPESAVFRKALAELGGP